MSIPRISRITSDAFNREHNTLVTANTLGKIFTGKEVSNFNFNTAITAGIYRFDSNHQNAPTDVVSGYAQITTINPDYLDNSGGKLRVRQIVYPDDITTAFTRIGLADSTSSIITWSEWAELGSGGGMFNKFQELTKDQLAEDGVLYRSFNSFVLTLPNVNNFKEGTYFGLDQFDALGAVIYTNGGVEEAGRLMYDPISELLFEMVIGEEEPYWIISNQEITESIVEDTSLRPSVEIIEYIEPQKDLNTVTGAKFIACVTKDRDGNLTWSIDTEDAIATVIKSLLSTVIAMQNELYAYVDNRDTMYRLHRVLGGANIVGKLSTLYRAFNDNVLTLPEPTTEDLGRWIGIEQQSGTTYVIDSHTCDNTESRMIYDATVRKAFELSISNNSYKWVLVNPDNYPDDIASNVAYRDANVKVRSVEITNGLAAFREFHISRNFSGDSVWVTSKTVDSEVL